MNGESVMYTFSFLFSNFAKWQMRTAPTVKFCALNIERVNWGQMFLLPLSSCRKKVGFFNGPKKLICLFQLNFVGAEIKNSVAA